MSLFNPNPNPNRLQPKGLNSYEVRPARRILSVLDAAVEHVVVGAQRHQYGNKSAYTAPSFNRVVGEDALQSYTQAMPSKSPVVMENPDVISMMMGPKLAYYENKGVGNVNTEISEDPAAAVAAARQGVSDAYEGAA